MSTDDSSKVRCPDGSWSKLGSRHCTLPLGHVGPHKYEIKPGVVPVGDPA